MFTWKRGAIALVAAAALALTGCSSAAEPEAETGTGTLTWGVVAPVSTFAAQNAGWSNESPFLQAVYDTLLRSAPDGSIEPNLATDWEYNDDKTVLTLTLRDDVEFTDGTPLTADAAAQNLNRFKVGTSQVVAFLNSFESAEAIDDTHLEITLTEVDPAFLVGLTQAPGLVQSPATFGAEDEATNPVGTGPYILNDGETVPGSTYVFDKNEDYWKPEDQHYAKLVLQVLADGTAMINAVKGGQVNVARLADNSTIPEAEAAGFTVNPLEFDWVGFLISDNEGTKTPALGDVRVRQAINYAIDRPAMLQNLGGGYGTVTEQIFPVSSPGFDAALDETYTYDPERAKELLAEAGYADGFTLVLPRPTIAPPASFALIAQQLIDIGIEVEFEDVEFNDFIAGVLGGRWSMTWFQMGQVQPDVLLAANAVGVDGAWNTFRVDDPEAQVFREILRTGTEEEAIQAGKDLNRYLVEEAWYAPAYRVQTTVVSDSNTEVTVQADNSLPYLWNIVPKG